MSYPITEADKDYFTSNGYLMPNWTLDETLVENCRSQAEVYHPTLRMSSENIVNPHIRLPLNVSENSFFALGTHPALIQMVSEFIGPNVVLWQSHLIYKKPVVGKHLKWHQDSHYFPLIPMNTVSVWIALEDCDVSNGCMSYLPGSHLHAYNHSATPLVVAFKWFIDDPSFDESSKIDVIRTKGQIAIHDGRMAHTSYANTSNRSRSAVVFRYIPSNVFYNVDHHSTRITNEFNEVRNHMGLPGVDEIPQVEEIPWVNPLKMYPTGLLLCSGESTDNGNSYLWRYTD